MSGKGSNPRPFDVPREVYESNHARIFGERKKKQEPVPPFAAPAQHDATTTASRTLDMAEVARRYASYVTGSVVALPATELHVVAAALARASEYDADPLDVIEFALNLAEDEGSQKAVDFLGAWLWQTDEFLRMHWPQFTELELARRCRAQRRDNNSSEE